jgi:hypothetical protein
MRGSPMADTEGGFRGLSTSSVFLANFKHLEKFGKLKNTEATTAVTQASSYNIKILLKTSQIEP